MLMLSLMLWTATACQTETAPMPTPVQPEQGELTNQAEASASTKTRAVVKEHATSSALSSLPSPRQAAETRPAEPEKPFNGKKIALIHTANMVGELEPCG